jgi:hypothetical protein
VWHQDGNNRTLVVAYNKEDSSASLFVANHQLQLLAHSYLTCPH